MPHTMREDHGNDPSQDSQKAIMVGIREHAQTQIQGAKTDIDQQQKNIGDPPRFVQFSVGHTFRFLCEYRNAKDAAQVRGSQYNFSIIKYGSPIFWVTRGYCVMENVEMPIVGTEDKEPNDTYIEQLVMDAEAAVKVITDMGVGDPERIGVGGHSYGAFMTGNLLTHTKLFKAGIARSGAYNRTLTPFGFQAETRTFWESPEVYNAMSPFMYANQLSGALLLVHGELDNIRFVKIPP